MAIPLTPKAPYPNVPDVAGVPPIARSSSVPPSPQPAFSTSDSATTPTAATVPEWGVFDAAGKPAFVVDTYMQIKPNDDVKVSTFPVEKGAFGSFNKVNIPNDVELVVSLGNDQAAMTELLSVLKTMINSTDLFTIVTPNESFLNMSLEKKNYSRTSKNGVSRLEVHLKFIEVREILPQFTTVALPSKKVKNPASASTNEQGKQQEQKTSVLSNLVNFKSPWGKK